MSYNPNRNPAGTSEGGQFASGDSMREEAGQVDAFGNEVHVGHGTCGDNSLGDEFEVSHRWTMPSGSEREARVTFHVTGQVNDPERYDYGEVEWEGITIPTDRPIDHDTHEEMSEARSALEQQLARDTAWGVDTGELRKRLDAMPDVGYSVESETYYVEYAQPDSDEIWQESIEYDYHSMMAHNTMEDATEQARALAVHNNWDHYDPERFF